MTTQRPGIAVGALLVPFTLSGAAALIAEMCWLRTLTVTLGGSSAALNIILVVFMGGLAIGAYLAKRVIRTTRHYLLLYAVLEAILAVYLLASSSIIQAVGKLFLTLLPILGHETLLEQFARLFVAGLALLPPTIVMGMTTPILITTAVQRYREVATYTGLLYGMNTLGAAIGALTAAVYLILAFGISHSLWIAAGLNLTAAVLALLINLAAGGVTAPVIQETREDTADPLPAEDLGPSPVVKYCLLAGVSGFIGMGLEVTFARLLVFMIGSSYYSHSISISGFLLGIVAGSVVVGLAAKRFRPREGFLPFLFAIAGLSAVGSALIFEALPLALQEYLVVRQVISLHPLMIKMIATLTLVVLPAMCSGMILPFLAHLLIQSTHKVTEGSSNILVYNTAGSVLGVLLTGYVLIEWVGVMYTLLFITSLSFITALLCQSWGRPLGRTASRVASGLALAGLVLALAVLPSKARTPLVVHSVLYSEFQDPEIRYYREDEGASVSAIYLPREDAMMLLINSLQAAEVYRLGVDRSLGPTTDVGMMSHPSAKSIFIAGLGSGRNAGVAGIYPGTTVESVEISDAVITALPYFDSFTYNASKNEKVEVILGDARHYLDSIDTKFDLILPDVFISALTGTAYLYNVEFFRQCADHLAPGGRVVLNVSLDSPIDRVIAAGFLAAFPHVEFIHLPSLGWYYLIAGNDPIDFPPIPVDRWSAHPEVMKRVRMLGLEQGETLAKYRIATRQQLEAELADVRPSTDDHPIVDYLHLLRRNLALTW